MLVRQANNTDEGLFIMKLPIDLKKIMVAMAASAVTVSALAATQGLLGTTSTGNFEVSLNVNPQVRVWGLEDLSFLSGGASQSVEFCTFNNNTDKLNITASSTNNFELRSNDPANSAKTTYTLTVADNVISGGSEIDMWGIGGLASGQQGSSQFITTGLGDDPAALGIGTDVCGAGSTYNKSVLTVDVGAAPAADGTYSDTVTLLVEAI